MAHRAISARRYPIVGTTMSQLQVVAARAGLSILVPFGTVAIRVLRVLREKRTQQ
jgi:hypothetical protein